jgi:hypothetical protein
MLFLRKKKDRIFIRVACNWNLARISIKVRLRIKIYWKEQRVKLLLIKLNWMRIIKFYIGSWRNKTKYKIKKKKEKWFKNRICQEEYS